MRKYTESTKPQLEQVTCNQCKKSLKVENGLLKEGCLETDVIFGYFSKRDGKRHRFDLCEECYNKMIAGFLLPVEESEETELL